MLMLLEWDCFWRICMKNIIRWQRPVLAHGLVNIVSVLLTEAGGFTWMFENPLRISLVSILCAAAASGIYVKFFMNDQKDEKISEEK